MTQPHTYYDTYGNAAMRCDANDEVHVIEADQRIGVDPDLWRTIGKPFRHTDNIHLQLDTAGHYLYRHVGYALNGIVVFDRVTEATDAH